MAKSIRENFVYNVINTVSGLLFPLITFPYASRILLADGLGQVNFFNSIINYVILLTSLGIPLYGIREIARVRDSPTELSKTTIEILSLNLLLNVIGYLIVFILCLSVAEIKENIPLFLLLSLSIFLTTIGCNWFYSGIEDFKFIALRGLAVRILGLVLLFSLVHDRDDLLYYGLYLILTSVGSNIINFFRIKNFIVLDKLTWSSLNIKKHIKPASSIFVLNLITSIYINLDKVMLGFISGSTSVGYYTAASQISQILLSLVSVLGGVMLPRASNLIKNEQFGEFFRLSEKSYNFILLISIPIVFGCIALSPVLIHLFCGTSYEPAIITLQIISPVVVAIGVSNLVGLQVLYPMGKVKLVTLSTCVGAITNFIFNIILIPRFAQNGAAIATICAEFSVTFTQFYLARKIVQYHFINVNIIKYICASIVMFIGCLYLTRIELSDLIHLFLIPISGAFIYAFILYLIKDSLAIEIFTIIKSKLYVR